MTAVNDTTATYVSFLLGQILHIQPQLVFHLGTPFHFTHSIIVSFPCSHNMAFGHLSGNFASLRAEASRSLECAVAYSFARLHQDGHWCGELRSNVTITAEYVMLMQSLGIDLSQDRDALILHFFAEQNKDGSWSIAPGYPGDISASVEAYLALKILGVDVDAKGMQHARAFILSVGGIAAVRIFTRIYLAMFGLFPWHSVPEIPAELILLPQSLPVNIYRFSSWARSTIIPLSIVSHHKPIYALPARPSLDHGNNDYLDELWINPSIKTVSYSPSLWSLLKKGSAFALGASVADKVIYYTYGFKFPILRKYALHQCRKWILDRQETSGDWAGIFPPMHLGILALVLEGFGKDHTRVQKGLEAIERFAWSDESNGKRAQSCVSPVWDTILTSIALVDAGLDGSQPNIVKAIDWVKDRQILGSTEGDWRVYSTNDTPGGFSFEYHNTWYPDVDDTAAAIISFLKQDPASCLQEAVISAITWIIGMQNDDGGWGAFDVQNDKHFLNDIPFSDMDSLCDPSTADVTGHILEAFGLWFRCLRAYSWTQIPLKLVVSTKDSCKRAFDYIEKEQEYDGSWYGRWGVNYIYGTSNVLCGLAYFTSSEDDISPSRHRLQRMADVGIQWLLSQQNCTDGGWGESVTTYHRAFRPEHAAARRDYLNKIDKGEQFSTPSDEKVPSAFATEFPSTPSQTGWALMGLLAFLPPSNHSILAGISYLTSSQRKPVDEKLILVKDHKRFAATARSWDEKVYTGTGFPNFFYLGYEFYSHYFPMMALGRWVEAMKRE